MCTETARLFGYVRDICSCHRSATLQHSYKDSGKRQIVKRHVFKYFLYYSPFIIQKNRPGWGQH